MLDLHPDKQRKERKEKQIKSKTQREEAD